MKRHPDSYDTLWRLQDLARIRDREAAQAKTSAAAIDHDAAKLVMRGDIEAARVADILHDYAKLSKQLWHPLRHHAEAVRKYLSQYYDVGVNAYGGLLGPFCLAAMTAKYESRGMTAAGLIGGLLALLELQQRRLNEMGSLKRRLVFVCAQLGLTLELKEDGYYRLSGDMARASSHRRRGVEAPPLAVNPLAAGPDRGAGIPPPHRLPVGAVEGTTWGGKSSATSGGGGGGGAGAPASVTRGMGHGHG